MNKNIVADLVKSFKQQPVWTVWSLSLAPFFYTFVFLAAVMLAAINLSIADGVDFWNEST